jgi:hypothetical protein
MMEDYHRKSQGYVNNFINHNPILNLTNTFIVPGQFITSPKHSTMLPTGLAIELFLQNQVNLPQPNPYLERLH